MQLGTAALGDVVGLLLSGKGCMRLGLWLEMPAPCSKHLSREVGGSSSCSPKHCKWWEQGAAPLQLGRTRPGPGLQTRSKLWLYPGPPLVMAHGDQLKQPGLAPPAPRSELSPGRQRVSSGGKGFALLSYGYGLKGFSRKKKKKSLLTA